MHRLSHHNNQFNLLICIQIERLLKISSPSEHSDPLKSGIFSCPMTAYGYKLELYFCSKCRKRYNIILTCAHSNIHIINIWKVISRVPTAMIEIVIEWNISIINLFKSLIWLICDMKIVQKWLTRKSTEKKLSWITDTVALFKYISENIE